MKFKIAVGAAILSVIGLGVSSAAIPDSTTGVITACRSSIGQLRVIDKQAGASCYIYGETEMSWNQSGPVGPQGPIGVTGPQGPAGVTPAFERLEFRGRDPKQPLGLWLKTVNCSAGNTVIAAWGQLSAVNDPTGQSYASMPLGIESSTASVTFGSYNIATFPPYVSYEVHVTCATIS